MSHFPVPPCVTLAKAEARSQQLPLANFIRTNATPTQEPLYYAEIPEMFSAYIGFLDTENERRVRNETTQTSFIRQLATSLEIKCSATHVIGWKLALSSAFKRAREDGQYQVANYPAPERISADADVR